MSRTLLATAVLATALSFSVVATPAHAASAVAVPAAPAKAERIVAGDTLWAQAGGSFRTAAITARPAVACAQVTRQIGAVSRFEVDGVALSADELAKCNAKAKGGAATALARN